MIKVGIIGATGYAGGELVRILMGHKDAEIKWYGSRSYIDQKYASIYQNMFRIVDDACMDDNMKELAEQVDVVFTPDLPINEAEIVDMVCRLQGIVDDQTLLSQLWFIRDPAEAAENLRRQRQQQPEEV